MADAPSRPGLLSRVLALAEQATRPGTYPPAPEVLAALRDAATALEDAEFVTLAHEASLGLSIAEGAAAVGGILPVGLAELGAVDDAWGIAGASSLTAQPTAVRPTRTPPPAAHPASPTSPTTPTPTVRRTRTARDPAPR